MTTTASLEAILAAAATDTVRRRDRGRGSADRAGGACRGGAAAAGQPAWPRPRRARTRWRCASASPRARLDGAVVHRPASISRCRDRLRRGVRYPCVVKPLGLSGSRGVIRANDVRAVARPSTGSARCSRGPRCGAARPGLDREMHRRGLHRPARVRDRGGADAMAVSRSWPSSTSRIRWTARSSKRPSTSRRRRSGGDGERAIVDTVQRATTALGLRHGPVHAECRVDRWRRDAGGRRPPDRRPVLARAALHSPRRDESAARSRNCCCGTRAERTVGDWVREPRGGRRDDDSDPERGISQGRDRRRRRRGGAHVEEIRITAKRDQLLEPLPEGDSYLGFIFAPRRRRRDRGGAPLRAAHHGAGISRSSRSSRSIR